MSAIARSAQASPHACGGANGSAPHVVVVGGGLAGLQAALVCADAGARVSLLEARPRLGGATWSLEKRGLRVDNGQHVFMRCCSAYLSFLERVGVADRVELQPRLAVPVAAPGRPLAWIRRGRLPAPAHLVPSLLGFTHLPFAARLRAARAAARFRALDPDDERLDRVALGDWLARAGVRDAATLELFDLLIRPTLNLPAAEASLALAAKVMRTGFLDRTDAADLGSARVPLADLHAGPAERALRAAGAALATKTRVDALRCDGAGVVIHATDARLRADAAILAVPPEALTRIAPPEAGVDTAALARLGRSPILNLHVWFERPVLPLPFLAGFRTPLQWIFDRSEVAGIDRGQLLTVSLSAADAWLGRSRAELREHFLPAFHALLPASRGVRVLELLAVSEPAATFRQSPGTRLLRPQSATKHPAVFVAGSFTDTGWPATMESAVRSGTAAGLSALRALAAAPRRVARVL